MATPDSFAQGWYSWFQMIGPAAQPTTDAMIRLAQIEPGHLVLDAATGIGEPALSVARVVGPKGLVLAVDHSEEMLALARERAADQGITQVRFQKMDLDDPHLAARNFHAVLCRWGLMFVADLQDSLCSLYTALRPGGRCAVTVWGPPERVPALSLAAQTLAKVYGDDWADPSMLSAFALQDNEELAQHFTQAGFEDIQGLWVPVIYHFASVWEFLTFRLDCSTAFRAGFEALTAPQRANAEALIIRAVEPYQSAEGALIFENWAYCLVGQRPHET